MILFLYLAISLGLSASDTVRGDEEANSHRDKPLQDIQKKVNDLWQILLYSQFISEGTDRTGYATCEVKPSSNLDADKPQVTGHVLFKQSYPNGKLEVLFDLDGFPSHNNQSGRAIHIHELGDLSKGCDSAGGHYNPFNVNHPHHPGDFGNFNPKGGKIRKHKTNLFATLFGPYSVIGRSIVIHEQEDDMGKGGNQASLENGNAGKRLACCVIGICKKNLWEKNSSEGTERRKRKIPNEQKTTRPN